MSATVVDRPGPPPTDGRISWCRIFRIGPPCPHVCGGCAVIDRQITNPKLRAKILEGNEPEPSR